MRRTNPHVDQRPKRSASARQWCWSLFGLLLCITPTYTLAQTKVGNCAEMFRLKQYIKAAQCFEKKANLMGATANLSKIQRYLKGQNLRNAALSYKNAANEQKQIEVAAYRREQAVFILRRYLKQNLCQRQYLCRLAKGDILALVEKIKYIQLSIVTTPEKRAIVELQGYKFKAQHYSPPQWNKQVRPGPYKLVVKYEGKPPIKREIIAVPGKNQTVTVLMKAPPAPRRVEPPKRVVVRPLVRPRKPPPPKPPAFNPWILAGVGLAVAAGGAAMLIVAQVNVDARDQKLAALRETSKNTTPDERANLRSLSSTASEIEQSDAAHKLASNMILPGWLAVGIGGATMVTGIILVPVLQPKPAKTTSTLPPPSSTTLVHLKQ